MTSILLAAALMCLSRNIQGETPPPIRLSQYIQSLNWDPAKSGPLLVLEPDKVFNREGSGKTLSDFQEKLVKVGGLSVICLNWTIAFEDSELPNAYQSLSNQDKLIFLLATLSPADLAKLTTTGLSPNDVSGEQRQALLSMISNPLRITEGESDAGEFTPKGEPKAFPHDQAGEIHVQLRKGINVFHDAMTTKYGNQMAVNLSSLDYSPPGIKTLIQSNQNDQQPHSRQWLGRVADSKEKKSEISWNDPRLLKPVELTGDKPVTDWVADIRAKTGVEIYADSRVGSLKLNGYGSVSSASDLLRGLTLGLGGVIRRVGPAYLLTANIEGEATRDTRLEVRRVQGQEAIHAELEGWKANVLKRGLFEKMAYAFQDPLSARDIPTSEISALNSDWNSSWIPLSRLPSTIQDAVHHEGGAGVDPSQGAKPDPNFAGLVKIAPTFGFRLVLPDGRPLENQNLDVEAIERPDEGKELAKATFPINNKSLPPGSAVGIKADAAEEVSKLCSLIKAQGIPEIWLDTESPTAIRAATNSGLMVDLVLHPWRLLKGEACPDPDRNVLGQTGGQLNQVPGVGLIPVSHHTKSYATSFSPSSTGLVAHWDRLTSLARTPGVHRLIVLDAEPEGYEAVNEMTGAMVVARFSSELGLRGNVPRISQFGYSTSQRLAFLRKHQMDPIDIAGYPINRLSPPNPYFDYLRGFSRLESPFPDVDYPQFGGDIDDVVVRDWTAMRHSLITEQLAGLLSKLATTPSPVFVEDRVSDPDKAQTTPFRSVFQKSTGEKPLSVQYLAINPLSAQDEQGQLTWKPDIPTAIPTCFDLSEVPMDRMPAFLRYIFKPAARLH